MKKGTKAALYILLSLLIVASIVLGGFLIHKSVSGKKCTHDEEMQVTKAATCTKAGIADIICKKCGETVKKDVVIPAQGHTYEEFTVTKAATCTDVGEIKYVCTRCEEEITEVTPALGHNYGDWIVAKEPTCTELGIEEKVCARDGYKETRPIDKLPHTASEWIIDVEPTCETAGERHIECTVCQTVLQTEEIPALGHDYGDWTVTKASTCTEEGEEKRVCAHDETHVETRTVDKLAHTASDWIIDSEATCTETGLKHIECTDCHTVLTFVTIQTTPHNFTDEGPCADCGWDGLTYGYFHRPGTDPMFSSYGVIGADPNLKKAVIAENHDGRKVDWIKYSTFQNHKNIKEVVCNDSLMYIGESAFENSTIEIITVNKETSWMQSSCFANSNLKRINTKNVGESVFPERYRDISENAFTGTNIETLQLIGVQHIRKEAFSACNELKTLSIHQGKIYELAFANCENLEKVNLSFWCLFQEGTYAVVSGVHDDAFLSCHNLHTIRFTDNVNMSGRTDFTIPDESYLGFIPDSVTLIEVPNQYLDQCKTAWASYADIIVGY